MATQQLLDKLAAALKPSGIDIVHPFYVQLYNNAPSVKHPLPTFGLEKTFSLLLGNTKAIWPPFIEHLVTHPQLLQAENPLDEYVVQAVSKAMLACSSTNIEYHVRFSHETDAKFVNMVEASRVAGLAYYNNGCHLCVHATYGPWFALRAVVSFNMDGNGYAIGRPLPSPVGFVEALLQLEKQQTPNFMHMSLWPKHWRYFVDLRDAVGAYIGRAYRYSDEQLEYHYSNNKAVLYAEVKGHKASHSVSFFRNNATTQK